jgi:hypothetical protein
MEVLAATMKGVAAHVSSKRMGHETTSQRIFARKHKLTRRLEIHARLFIGPEQLMLFKPLQPKVAATGMALYTAHITFAFSEEDGLNFILEEIKIELGSLSQ